MGKLDFGMPGGGQATAYKEANSINLIAGTSSSSISDLQTLLDGNTYDIVEAASTPGTNLEVSFTGVTAINRLVVAAFYDGNAAHAVRVQLYNYTDTAWDTIHTMNDGRDIEQHFKTIVDDSDYISSGAAKVRFYHAESGSTAHDLYIDYVALAYSVSPYELAHDDLGGITENNHHNREHAMSGASDHSANNWKCFYSDGSGDVQEVAIGGNDQVLTSNGAAAAPSFKDVTHPTPTIDLYPGLYLSNAAVDPIGTSKTQLSLDTEQIASSKITFSAANNSITLTGDGIYKVEYDACFTEKDTLGAARGTVETHLEDDSGGTMAYSPGSYGRTYTRETSYQGACHGSTFIKRDGSDVEIKLYATKIYTSNNNIKATALGTSVKVIKVQ
jgi:hypothetical protein